MTFLQNSCKKKKDTSKKGAIATKLHIIPSVLKYAFISSQAENITVTLNETAGMAE